MVSTMTAAGAVASELWIAAAMRQSDAEIETIVARPLQQRAPRRLGLPQSLAKRCSAARSRRPVD